MSAGMVGGIVGLLAGLAFVVCCVWFWAAMLVNAAKNGKWVWFAMLIIFPLLCLLYVLVGHERIEERVTYRDERRIEPEL